MPVVTPKRMRSSPTWKLPSRPWRGRPKRLSSFSKPPSISSPRTEFMPTTTPTSRNSAATKSSASSSPPRPEDGSSEAESSPAIDTDANRHRTLAVIGGGTGLAVLLRGLKHHVGEDIRSLTAVVTVADDGGSSGRLRRDFGVLPPGDIRNCIVALADDEDLLARLFQYRFPGGEGLGGHSFGNLFLTALAGITGDFYQAVHTAESILAVRGRILPATLSDVRLRGAGLSGRIYEGESAVGKSGERMRHLELQPAQVAAFPPAVRAITEADLVVLGPGSLYTSVLPNLLIPGIRDALRRTKAPVLLVLNLMTQPGETDRMDAHEHLEAIERHAGAGLVDCVLVNVTPPDDGTLAHYTSLGSQLLALDEERLSDRGICVVEEDLLAPGDLIRHDPAKLSQAVLRAADRLRGEETGTA